MSQLPNPGSDEALAMGCSCPVLDNAYGRGSVLSRGFVINMECPLHGPKEEIPIWVRHEAS